MPYTGQPSAGCKNCRDAKKRCERGLPACARCIRLGKACGGYRDMADLIFKDQTAEVARRASNVSQGSTTSGTSTSSTRQQSPEVETEAKQFFFRQFVTAGHLSFLEGISPDDFLLKPMLACALAAMANREDSESRRELSRQYYLQAISATNVALRHPRRVKEDNTLVAVCLLAIFERLSWERGGTSMNSWKNHIEGAGQVLQLRGRSRIRTKTGAMIFRELRDRITNSALLSETEVPEYIFQWTQALEFDAMYTPADQLAVLAARTASLRTAFRLNSKSDEELAELGKTLEQDLLNWSESTLAAGSVCSFYNVRDLDSTHAWSGTRHEYGIPQAHRHWNLWRCLRIILSRLQEAVWRRSWPLLAQPSQPVPDSEHYRAIRNRMVNDICVAVAYAFGNDSSMEPPRGAVSSGYLLIMPLCVAGTCLLEQLAEPTVTPGGTRMIFVDEPLHLDLFNQTSTQLAWIIEKVDYVADRVGIRWAKAVGRFLKGESQVYYDLGRSRVVKNEQLEKELYGEMLDLGQIVTLSDIEETGSSSPPSLPSSGPSG